MKIQTLIAVLISAMAIGTVYAADEATSNATGSVTTAAAPKNSAMESSTPTKKEVKKHTKHKKHKKHKHNCHQKAAASAPVATDDVAPSM